MTEMINGLLLKYKREAARPGLVASHKTVVLTLTYHHQQIIIVGHRHHHHHHQDTMGNSGRQDRGGWMMGQVGGGKNIPALPPCQHSQYRERNVCVALAYFTLMTAIL